MRKKIFLFLMILTSFFSLSYGAEAVDGTYNGGAVSGSTGGGVKIGSGSDPGVWHSTADNDINLAAYVVRIIYSNGNDLSNGDPNNWEMIGHPIVIVAGSGIGQWDHRGILNNYARAKSGRDAYYNEQLARYIYQMEKGQNGVNSSTVTNWLNANDNANAIALFDKMGANDKTKYTKKNVRAKRDGSSYRKPGYRMIVEKLISVSPSGASEMYVTTRKSLARSVSEKGTKDACGFWLVESAWSCGPRVYGESGYNNKFFGEIHTEFNDINVATSNYSYENFKSYNKGAGLHIYDPNYFGIVVQNYDYYIDAACTNCDSKNGNGSYYIQDIDNWDAILASKEATKKGQASTYYDKGNGVYCREEYKIILPNANDSIEAEAGRYFTVNKATVGKMYKEGIPNLKEIAVQKIRQCKGGNSQLETFYSANGIGSLGKIVLKYDEGKYNKTITLEKDSLRTTEQKTNSDGLLTIKSTTYYKLPDDAYRYVSIDGKAEFEKPSKIEHFVDLETSNLPISIDNYAKTKTSSKGASITLQYTLPEVKENSNHNIKKAFEVDGYLGKTEKTVYTDNQNNKKNSSCAKLFGYNTTDYNSCVMEHQGNSTGKCRTNLANSNYYSCDVNVCPYGEVVCDNGKCGEPNKCQNPKCKIVGDTYYGVDGKTVSKDEYFKQCPVNDQPPICVVKNGKYYGSSGIEVTKEEYLIQCPDKSCSIQEVNGKKYYYGFDGQLTTKAKYEEKCSDGNNGKCPVPCEYGCCPSGICAPMPMVNGMIVCPGITGNRIIYRTIDLNNPFPAQNGLGRSTGDNWCFYNITNKSYNCEKNNAIVNYQILNGRNASGNKIYSNTPLYKFHLDSNIITKIKNYNSKNKDYADSSTLKCNSKTGICQSKMFRDDNVVTIDVNTEDKRVSKCKSASGLSTCAEAKG